MARQTAQIQHVFGNIQKRIQNTAQRRLSEQLPAIMHMAREYAVDYQHSEFGNMTGNWLNSFGVALYRDGRPVAVANMANTGLDSPIRTTLIDGDIFKSGSQRFDGTFQIHTFEIDGDKYQGAAEQVYYDEEVLQWLSKTSTRSKGFSLRVITVAEYHIDTSRRVLLRLSEEMESRGGNVWNFNLG